ncbi:MAG: DUF6498-containing protein [Hyphomicrobium sp.]
MTQIVSDPRAAPDSAIRWPEVVAGVALNLIPIAGVLFWHWSPFALIFLYWLENVVIGARTLASIFVSGFGRGPVSGAGSAALGAFFTVHYGMFCFVHGMFVMLLFGNAPGATTWGGPFDLAGAAGRLFATQSNLAVGFASIVLWQVVVFVLFVMRGEATRMTPSQIMSAPYGRIIILHVTVLFGGFVLMSLGWPIIGVVLLAAFKTLADVAPALGLRGPAKKAAT